MPADRQTDEHNRVIFSDREVPDPWSPESRFAQWRGKTCGPWTVITVTEQRHRQVCRSGWTDNDRWWYVCGRCHPTAVDMPGTSSHQGGPPARTKEAHTVDVGHDLEQRIKTMERQLRLVAHIAEIDSGALEDQVRDIEKKLAEGWVPPARSAAEIVDELRREEANRG